MENSQTIEQLCPFLLTYLPRAPAFMHRREKKITKIIVLIHRLIFLYLCVMFSLGVEIPVTPPTTPASSTEEPSGERSNVYLTFHLRFSICNYVSGRERIKNEMTIMEV